MKKLLYVLLAAACTTTIFSCKKELEINKISEQEQTEQGKEAGNVVTIHAGFDDVTKTSYAGEVTFSWTAGDKIGVWTTNDTDYEKVIFTAQSSGPSVEFQGTLSEGYHLIADGKAFYPDGNADARNNFVSTFDGTDYTVTLGGTIDVDLNNPMAVIPLVGNNDGTGNFSFKTATGLLKVTFDNLKAETGYICVEKGGNEFALNGTFTLENDEVKMSNATATYSLKYLKVSGVIEGSSGVFYFPIATGNIPAGIQFKLINTSYSLYIYTSTATTKIIPITRNRITNISVPLDGGSQWEYLGVGKFMDNYSFALADKTGCMVDVDILKSRTDSKLFAVVNPYGSAWSTFGESYSGATNIMNLAVKKIGDSITGTNNYQVNTIGHDDIVFFYGDNNVNNAINTGISSASMTYRIYHPIWSTANEDTMLNSKVVAYQSDGVTPAVITLAPALQKQAYNGSLYWLDGAKSAIYIIFPDCDPVAAITGVYNISSDNTAYQITLSASDDSTKGNVMITGYKGSWTLSGKIYGNYNPAEGTITFNQKQAFNYDESTSYYYHLYTGTSVNENSFAFAFDKDSFLSDSPSESKKLYAGRVLKTTVVGFGLGKFATPTSSLEYTNNRWTTSEVRFYKVVN